MSIFVDETKEFTDSGLSFREAVYFIPHKEQEKLYGKDEDPTDYFRLLGELDRKVEALIDKGKTPGEAVRRTIYDYCHSEKIPSGIRGKIGKAFASDKNLKKLHKGPIKKLFPKRIRLNNFKNKTFPYNSLKGNSVYCVSETAIFLSLAERWCDDFGDYLSGREPRHFFIAKKEGDGFKYMDYGCIESEKSYERKYGRPPEIKDKRSTIAGLKQNAGLDLSTRKRYRDAIRCLIESCKIDPTVIRPSRIYEEKKSLDDNLDDINIRIEQNPDNLGFWNEKGNILYKLERYCEAIACHSICIEKNHQVKSYWNNIANGFFGLGLYGDTMKCYEKALKIDPDYEIAKINKDNTIRRIHSDVGNKYPKGIIGDMKELNVYIR